MKIQTGIRKNNGERVYEYNEYTYGVIEKGIAVTSEAGYYPFFEIMPNKIEWDGEVEIDKWKFHSDDIKSEVLMLDQNSVICGQCMTPMVEFDEVSILDKSDDKGVIAFGFEYQCPTCENKVLARIVPGTITPDTRGYGVLLRDVGYEVS